MTCTEGTVKEPAHDVGGGRVVPTVDSADGAPYVVPLSFDWDGEARLMAAPTDSPTGRNLAATRLGPALGAAGAQKINGPKRSGGLGSSATRDRASVSRDGRRATPADTADQVHSGPWLRLRRRRRTDVLLEARQIEPRDADGGREGGPVSQMEPR